MAEPKTRKTKASVAAFIAAVENETRRKDAMSVDLMMRDITGEKPTMWGPSIIGYGEYDGPTGAWPRAAFSPRKANLVVYLEPDCKDGDLLNKLGKHKTSKSCLYINKLTDVDERVLRELVLRSWKHVEAQYS